MGKYYSTSTASQLQEAFQKTIFEILESSASLSSPAVAINNFDRTQSLNDLYFSMFAPSAKGIWRGNIKKLMINELGIVMDKNGDAAIGDNGAIKDSATTFWSSEVDGSLVTKGGVSEALKNAPRRSVLSNIHKTDSGALSTVNKSNLKLFYNVTSDAGLATAIEEPLSELDGTLAWLVGKDTFDNNENGNKTENRDDIFADPLHSSPAVITYVKKQW